jgi:hypothetical protein
VDDITEDEDCVADTVAVVVVVIDFVLTADEEEVEPPKTPCCWRAVTPPITAAAIRMPARTIDIVCLLEFINSLNT